MNRKGCKVAHNIQWKNNNTIIEYVQKILVPYVTGKIVELLASARPLSPKSLSAVVVWDNHPQARSGDFVPENITYLFSLPDVSFNKPAKAAMKASYTNTYFVTSTYRILRQMEEKPGIAPADIRIDTTTTTIKPVMGVWLVGMWESLKEKEADLTRNGMSKIQANVKVALEAQPQP